MKLIAFVGMPASGKSEASSIAKRMGIPVVNMGDAVREETARRGMAPTDQNIGGTGSALRREEGMAAIAARCIPKIREFRCDLIVVDGVRNKNEIDYFKKEFGNNFKLIAINAPFEIRFKRVRKRARSDDMKSMDELKTREERERSWGLEQAIEEADIMIDNRGTLEKFQMQIHKLLGCK